MSLCPSLQEIAEGGLLDVREHCSAAPNFRILHQDGADEDTKVGTGIA